MDSPHIVLRSIRGKSKSRPDWQRYVRPDWRRFVKPGYELDRRGVLVESKDGLQLQRKGEADGRIGTVRGEASRRRAGV